LPRLPVPRHAGPAILGRAIELNGIGLALADHLIVIAAHGMVLDLDAAARRLWEALQAGCTLDDLVRASILEGGLPEEDARSHITRTLASWRVLGLVKSGARAR
jgi:hypothetical protein